MVNIILIVVILAAGGYGAYRFYQSIQNEAGYIKADEEEVEHDVDIKQLIFDVSNTFRRTLSKRFEDENLTRQELLRKKQRTATLRHALTEASYGDRDAKRIVKGHIKDILSSEQYDMENIIDTIIPFNDPKRLRAMDKFEILLFIYMKQYREQGFAKIIEEFNLVQPLYENGEKRYAITKDIIHDIYNDVCVEKNPVSVTKEYVTLTYNDKLDILCQRVYEKYIGFGPIDMLYECNIDEIDCGQSGIPDESIKNNMGGNLPYTYESIWTMYHGLNIQLECLTFETQSELIRVTDNVYKYDAPHVMSRTAANIIATMKDGSRITAARPPFSNTYAFWLRKFDSTPGSTPKDLVKQTSNYLAFTLLMWIIKGEQNMIITGDQGSGKTTLMRALVRYIDPAYTIRVFEKQAELNLQYTYPMRSIVSFQETSSISIQEGLDFGKKTNGAVTLIGEVAEAVQAGYAIQTARVASKFLMATHHATTAEDLVEAFADNTLQIKLYQNKNDAIRACADVLNIDCHVTKEGGRHIERITEIIPLKDIAYPSDEAAKDNSSLTESKELSPQEKAMMDAPEYFKRVTNPRLFETVDIIRHVHDEENEFGRFVIANMPSEKMIQNIRKTIAFEEQAQFDRDMKMLKKFYKGSLQDNEEENKWIQEASLY